MGNIQKILFKTAVLSIFSNGSDPLSIKLVMIEQLMHKNQPEICLQYMNLAHYKLQMLYLLCYVYTACILANKTKPLRFFTGQLKILLPRAPKMLTTC